MTAKYRTKGLSEPFTTCKSMRKYAFSLFKVPPVGVTQKKQLFQLFLSLAAFETEGESALTSSDAELINGHFSTQNPFSSYILHPF